MKILHGHYFFFADNLLSDWLPRKHFLNPHWLKCSTLPRMCYNYYAACTRACFMRGKNKKAGYYARWR